MRKLIYKALTLVLSINILTVMLPQTNVFADTKSDTNLISDWTVAYMNGVDAEVSYDETEKMDGDRSVKIINNSAMAANVYVSLTTLFPAQQGKTYRYSLKVKGKKVGRALVTIDWGTRNSLKPVAATSEWAKLTFDYTRTAADGNASLIILVDDKTEGLWIDEVTCYEYDGEIIGDNLIKNSSFESGYLKREKGKTGVEESGSLEAYNMVNSSAKFDAETYFKAEGALKNMNVQPADITVDGSADDWNNVRKIEFPILPGQVDVLESSANVDAKGWYSLAYDNDNFYMIAEIEDDKFNDFNNGNDYWKGDGIQFALGSENEEYGKEYGLVYAEGDGGIYSGYAGAADLMKMTLKCSRSGNKTIYEVSMPWAIQFADGRPDEVLFDMIYNDNDGSRGYCLQIAPGIVRTKSNADFVKLHLQEKQDIFSYITGPRSVMLGGKGDYDIYIVNSGEEKNIDVISESLDISENHTLAANQGIKISAGKNFDELMNADVDLTVKDSDKEYKSVQTTAVLPTKDTVAKIVERLESYTNRLDKLMKECEVMGIPTDYEKTRYTILRLFKKYIMEDYLMGEVSRIGYIESELDELFHEAEANMEGYLDGTKEPYTVPKYVTGKTNIEGQTIYADMDVNGEIEKRPAFLLGYLAYYTGRNNIKQFNDLGVNTIQVEPGITSVLTDEGGVDGWASMIMNDANAVAEQTDDGAGGTCLKITNKSAMAANRYIRVSQYILNYLPDTEYTLSFRAKAVNAQNTWICPDGFDIPSRIDLSGTYDWKEFNVTWKSKAINANHDCLILCGDQTEALYIDDVSIKMKDSDEELILNGNFEAKKHRNGDYWISEAGLGRFKDILQRAADNNVSVNLLLGMHYFSDVLAERFPEVFIDEEEQKNAIGGIKNFKNERFRNIIKMYLEELIPIIKDYPSLQSICLTNEPTYNTMPKELDIFLPYFTEYLEEKFENDINKLNEAYGTNYSAFSQVEFPREMDGTPRYYDWADFNCEFLYEFHQYVADIIRELAPDIPLHAKMMDYTTAYENDYKRTYYAMGTDHEKFARFSDINGCDSWWYLDDGTQGTLDKFMWYDLQTSIKKAPVANSEDHIIADYNHNYEGRQELHLGTDLWQGALHGRGISDIWVYERNFSRNSVCNGSILERPDCLAKASDVCMDLNRLSYEVTALETKKADVAILYSNAARNYNRVYMNAMYNAYEALQYNGNKVEFVTENQIEKINDYKLLILSQTVNVTLKTSQMIREYINNGGTVVMLGDDCVTKTEYDRPLPEEIVSEIKTNSKIIAVKNDGYMQISPTEEELNDQLFEITSALGLNEIQVIDCDTGERVKHVEIMTAEYNGRTIVDLCNYDWNTVKNIKLLVNGQEVTKGKDLITGEEIADTFSLENYTPRLISLEDGISVIIDGKIQEFDVNPIIENDRVLVPFRKILETLGAGVEWHEETQSVLAKKEDTSVLLQIDNPYMQVNGQEILLDTAPKIKDGRTLVPIRAVSESFCADVQWNDASREVIITSQGN